MYLNEVNIIGNLTRQPELKVLDNGTHLTNLSVAINEDYTDDTGTKIEKTEFVSVVVFGSQADNCAKYLVKGQKVYVKGKISNKAIEKPDGTKDYKTGVIAHRVQFGSKPKETPMQYPDDAQGGVYEAKEPEKKTGRGGVEYPVEDINPDDIPF